MIKFIVRFFLSLTVLLWTGYSLTYAYNHQGEIPYPSLRHLIQSEDSGLGTKQNSQDIIAFSPYGLRNLRIEATICEVEEDELIPIKKLDRSNYFTTLFDILTSEYFFNHIKPSLPYCKHLTDFSFHNTLYLLFLVFRI